MKFLKYLLFLLLIAVIGMAIYVAVQPNDFKITESSIINAPQAVVFENVMDSPTDNWSSFWTSSEELKKSETYPNDSIVENYSSARIKNSELKWTFSSNPNGSTNVTRSLNADHLSFLTKAKYAVFGDQDDDILKHFKQDLKDLHVIVQKSMSAYDIKVDDITDYGGGFYLYKSTSSSYANIYETMSKQFEEITSFMIKHRITASGKPFTIYIDRNAENGSVIMTNAIPVSERIIVAEDSNILCSFMERTKAVKVTLKGDYVNLEEAWKKAQNYLQVNEMVASELSPFEVYTNDPTQLPNPAHWITEIYIPIVENLEVDITSDYQ